MPASESAASVPTTDKPPRRRRWIPLSLRLSVAILFCLGAISACTAWLLVWLPFSREQRAIRVIQDRGGRIEFMHERGPDWLRRLGKQFQVLDRVRSVNWNGSTSENGFVASDVDLKQIEDLVEVEDLNLAGTAVTDSGLATLCGLRKLKSLIISETAIGDDGLEHLARIESLELLNLDNTHVADAGLAHLRRLAGLHYLHLSGTRVGDTGMMHLRNADLKIIGLRRTQIGDIGLAHLAQMANLETLDISATEVGDAGLPHLRQLSKLRSLHMEGTQVTARGVGALQVALPDSLIFY
jgi:hypothetical protein